MRRNGEYMERSEYAYRGSSTKKNRRYSDAERQYPNSGRRYSDTERKYSDSGRRYSDNRPTKRMTYTRQYDFVLFFLTIGIEQLGVVKKYSAASNNAA